MSGSYSNSIFLILFVLSSVAKCQIPDEGRKPYIVYMGNTADSDQSPSSYHLDMLQQVVDPRFLRQSYVRSYGRTINGFAAYLTPQEQEILANHEEVVSIFPSRTLHPQTTRSWDFIGFPKHVHHHYRSESDTIIGVIDTGIWPESESFHDKGFGPPPKKWKGACEGGANFTCNNKLIGARYYNTVLSLMVSARDLDGHGTHTASTAAGNYVRGANFYDVARGTARGGVPSARIAAYRVCTLFGCADTDILAAFDDAIADGVDVISISLGGDSPVLLDKDVISIGALHASLKGILVVQSAGNNRVSKSVLGVAPWVFSVAASSIDRSFVARVSLGNGDVLTGRAVNSFDLKGDGGFPLVRGDKASYRNCSEELTRTCECLDPELVKNKIVMCSMYDGMGVASSSGALGMILTPNATNDVSYVVPFPASSLNVGDIKTVHKYFSSTKFPKANILMSKSVMNKDSPRVASFSGKGPNAIIPDIMKPDITAPGVEILAAFSPIAPPSDFFSDKRHAKYNILSGTSMACPHVSEAASYVKSLHPKWSPSAIKSALMTTAWKMDAKKEELAEFTYGTGMVNPVKAANPGLVYESTQEDYTQLLCGLGYDSRKLRKVFGVNSSCPIGGVHTTPKDLNYPSMAAQVRSKGNFKVKFMRTVTNVGRVRSRYKAITSTSKEYHLSVKPSVLKFEALNEKKSFEVVITRKINSARVMSAALEWFDGVHRVRSPIVLYSVSS